ncbi:hypothetical protein BD779DRAFT_1465377 [Infundibulicybe gibba]|nr:hypothetical protein BD779DRAFT_1465377 [Infundibulicybe gibba]
MDLRLKDGLYIRSEVFNIARLEIFHILKKKGGDALAGDESERGRSATGGGNGGDGNNVRTGTTNEMRNGRDGENDENERVYIYYRAVSKRGAAYEECYLREWIKTTSPTGGRAMPRLVSRETTPRPIRDCDRRPEGSSCADLRGGSRIGVRAFSGVPAEVLSARRMVCVGRHRRGRAIGRCSEGDIERAFVGAALQLGRVRFVVRSLGGVFLGWFVFDSVRVDFVRAGDGGHVGPVTRGAYQRRFCQSGVYDTSCEVVDREQKECLAIGF